MSTRRQFLTRSAAALAAMAALDEWARPALAQSPLAAAGGAKRRLTEAYQKRIQLATRYLAGPAPSQPPNGDEARHPNFIGQFHKTLPHDADGLVDPSAYRALVAACMAGDFARLEAVPRAAGKLANPLGADAFGIEGWDSHHLVIPAASSIDSPQHAGDMAECYWLALTRDVPFDDYATDPSIAQAAGDLRHLPGYGWVSPANLFRGRLPGDQVGPYVSQFLIANIPYGPMTLPQRIRVPMPGNNWLASYPEWLAAQNGLTAAAIVHDPEPRWIANGAALAEWVHSDFSYQGFLNAALILLALGPNALDPNNPYRASTRQAPFVTFGGPAILDLVARAGRDALMAAWYPKWQLHRKVRPEGYAGLVENTRHRGVPQHNNPTLGASNAPDAVFSRYGTYLLPMAYPEGAPTHPSYPAGHAVIAGACVTVLKAFFDEAFVLPAPVIPTPDGLGLVSWTGAALTVGGELNKLASNCALARDTAGVHYRQDGEEGIRLGEQVGLALLRDFRGLNPEPFAGFRLTLFDGTAMVV